MDRDDVKQIRDDLSAYLTTYCDDFAKTFDLGRAVYDPANGMVKFELTIAEKTDGGPPAGPAMEWVRCHRQFGLPADGFGKKIFSMGVEYEIVGLAPRRRKFPVVVKRCSDGKGFALTADTVRRGLGLQA